MRGPCTPTVGVVIVNWNSGKYLERCIEAISRQTHRPNKIVVVDNGSTDGSIVAIETRYHDVRILKLAENIGFAGANNRAIAMLKDSDWVALVNPDAFPTANWLAEMLRVVEENTGYDFFGCRLVQADDHEILDGTGDVYHVAGLGWRRDYGKPAGAAERGNDEIFAPCAAAAIYRREVLDAVNGFDESFFCYFEDVDLGFRLRLAGYRCMYVSSAVVYHQGSASFGKRSDFSVYHGHRNLVWTYVKNMPGVLFWWYLPQHFLLNLATILWYVLHGRTSVILKAKWDALKGLPVMCRRRRAIQASRKVSISDIRKVMARGWIVLYRRCHA
ncbi:MAG: glycosyltransferase family 2 protein [Gammaproteobacteria bacterium]|nr:glycosyltransferase family 2 protein [Gammaproteobacteria bacterium]